MSKNYQGRFTPQSGSTPPPKKKKRKAWQWVLLGVLILIFTLTLAMILFVYSTLNRINRPDPEESRLSAEEAASYFTDETATGSPDAPEMHPDDVTWSDQEAEIIGEEEHIINILLIGQDRRPGEGRARSDSMILASFNQQTNKITLVSFLRDNYVQIPDGYYDNRLNTAYAFGGMELLDDTLTLNFGVHVDNNIEVDFSGFSDIIDILGGVDLYLTQDEADYLDRNGSYGLFEGTNHLDGELALNYSRIRYLDSDFGRTGRQRNVLNSLFDKFRSIGIMDAMTLANKLIPYITTDMTNTEILSYVQELVPMLADAEIESLSIPGDDDYYNATIQGMMVLVPDLEACRAILADALR